MAYTPAYIDETGLHLPSFLDIENFYLDNAALIFGDDIVLDNSSMDRQLIAAVARVAYDTNQMIQIAYNNRSPNGAIGPGLDALLTLNGITRKAYTYSICPVTLTGMPFAVINNGVVSDTSGNNWDLPASVTLDNTGTAVVTATCETPGAVTAISGSINNIVTPTNGWTSVTNTVAATPGQPIEQDSVVKARQIQSVANPSQALTTGVLGGVLSLPAVISAQLYENDTNLWQGTINGVVNGITVGGHTGFPPNSITVVVNGGDAEQVASAIYTRKTPGCYTNGDQVQTLYDQNGNPTDIRFYNAISSNVWVAYTIHALTNYSSAVGDAVDAAIIDFINSNGVGQPLYNSQLEQAILSVNTSIRNPYFTLTSVTAGWSSGSLSTSNLVPDFQHYTVTDAAKITRTVT